MKLKEVFANFWRDCHKKDHLGWQQEEDSFSTLNAVELFHLVADELFNASNDFARVNSLGIAFLHDLLHLKAQQPNNLRIPFVQFQIGARNAHYFTSRKMMTEVFSWVSNALDDNFESIERSVEFTRLDDFLQSEEEPIQSDIKLSLGLWVGSMYYEARIVGGNNPVAMAFIPAYLPWYLKRWASFPDQETYSFSLGQILSWLKQHKKNQTATEVGGVLYQLHNSLPANSPTRKSIAIQFSSVDVEIGGRTRLEWCDTVLNDLFAGLTYHEKLQVLTNKFRGCESLTEDQINDLHSAIKEYREQLMPASETAKTYELSQIFRVLAPLLLQLSAAGNTRTSNDLMIKYFGIEEFDETSLNTIHIIPNDVTGIYLCSQGEVARINSDPEYFMPLITKAKNEFLGTTITLHDALDFVVEVPKRYGVPTSEKGEKFHQLLRQYFTFEKVGEFLKMHRDHGYYLFSGVNYPLQGIMSETMGFILPYMASLSVRREIRETKHILLWKGESLYSELECDGLFQILSAANYQVTVFDATKHDKRDFLKSYINPDFDLVWCCGHGEFLHYSPHESFLQMSDSVSLTIDDLNCANALWEGRRFFFLNACDGATTSLYNSPISIGLSRNMINSKQSLFSHLWPVHPLVAAIHAWLFACLIKDIRTPALVCHRIIDTIRSGKEAIISVLQTHSINKELLDRVDQSDLPFSEFYYWGSLAYFE